MDFFKAPPAVQFPSELAFKDRDVLVVPALRKGARKSPSQHPLDRRKSSKNKNLKGDPVSRLLLPRLDTGVLATLQTTLRDRKVKARGGEIVAFNPTPRRAVVLMVLGQNSSMWDVLTASRKAFTALKDLRPKNIHLALDGLTDQAQTQLTNAFVSAWAAGSFAMPKYEGQKKGKENEKSAKKEGGSGTKDIWSPLHILTDKKSRKSLMESAAHARLVTGGTNLVRRLTAMAGNDLTPSRYVGLALDLAKAAGLRSTFHDLKSLEKMGAGAFLAVSQASDDRGSGIVEITYKPSTKGKKEPKHLGIVGKGICFDTGGANLKTGSYMFGMNGDMAGSAVALATVLLAAEEKWPTQVTAWLAITDNLTGPRCYRPNDILHTLSGKTIEVIDTDAEGRIILSDALYLASCAAPDLLLDFATLTGSCVRALGTTYCGVFSRTRKLYRSAVRAGASSGERVWPFPVDEDYGAVLKSDYADLKQCRVAGGPDHIEAAWFLSQFVKPKVRWLHVDMSAIEHDGGLAHVPTKITGFGVRFAAAMAKELAAGGL